MLTSTRQASFCQHGRSLPSPPEISTFYSRLNHAYMHPLTCVKYGAAPAHSVTVPRGAASEYRICVSIIISAYGTILCAGPYPLYCMHYNYMYCLIASHGRNVLCMLSLWACTYTIMCKFFEFFNLDQSHSLYFRISIPFKTCVFVQWLLCAPCRVYCHYLFCSVYTCAPCRASHMKH